MTPTSFVRLNLFMWLAKTGKVEPTAEAFARIFRVHYQLKVIYFFLTIVFTFDCRH